MNQGSAGALKLWRQQVATPTQEKTQRGEQKQDNETERNSRKELSRRTDKVKALQ